MELSQEEVNSLQKKAVNRCSNTGCNEVSVSKRCGECYQYFYCSVECQKAHWPYHKEMCKFLVTSRIEKKQKKKEMDEVRKDLWSDLKKVYERWKLPRLNKLVLLADFLLPGDKWKTDILFILINLRVASNGEKVVELEMNSWQYFKIYDNKDDTTNIWATAIPIDKLRSQVIAARSTVPQHLQNYRQAQIYFFLLI